MLTLDMSAAAAAELPGARIQRNPYGEISAVLVGTRIGLILSGRVWTIHTLTAPRGFDLPPVTTRRKRHDDHHELSPRR